jgi:hypothetical protein
MFKRQTQLSDKKTNVSEQAKSTVSKNALVHGIYASDVLLPGESEEDFSNLYAAIRSDLNPEGALEEEAVLDIVRLHWLKRRAIKVAKGERPQGGPVLTNEGALERLIRFRKANGIPPGGTIPPDLWEDEDFAAAYVKASRETDVEGAATSRPEAAPGNCQPADLEQVIKLEAAIDCRIDKTLARLTRMKEFRKLYGQKAAVALKS